MKKTILIIAALLSGLFIVEAGAAPAFQLAGTAVSGTGAVSPAWPTHGINDVALLFVESAGGQPATLSTPAGFAAVTNSPQATGAGTAGTQITVFWARATSAAMTAPTVADPGDHVYARILTYRGVMNTGNPWDVTGGGVKAAASTSVTVTGVTTNVPDTLIVQAVARDNDSAAAAFSAETNASLTGILERSDAGTTSGNGGGFAVWDGIMSTAGATGDTAATVTSSINAFLTIALIPQPSTRFYMQNAAPDFATVTTNRGAWDSTASLLQRKLSRTKSGAIASKAVAEASATNNYDVFLLKLVSEPITTAQTISGTLNWVAGSLESSANMNANWHVHAYVTVGDTDTLRGTLVNDYTEAAGTNEWPTTAVGGGPTGVLTVTPVTISANDRIVIEAGYVARNALTTSYTGSLWYGGTNATDLALNGDETTLPGWWEFNSNLFPAVPDHILITHAGSALTCSPQTVTITACANAACTAPHYSGGANVTLTPGGQVFAIDATGINSAATVQQSTAGAVTLAATSVPAATSAATCWNTATSTASCAMTFNDSGFVVTVPNHTSCSNTTATIEAVQTAPGTGRCVPAYQNVTRAVNLYSSYATPASGTQVVTASTGAVSTTAPGTVHNLAFDVNGTVTITLSYPDAGQLTLTAGDTAPTGAAMTGSGSFVVAPASFAFSGIPAAPLTAGQAFNATVTAMRPACTMPAAPTAATPNFNGTVTLTSSNPQPAIGNATAINTTLSGFSNGAASTNLTWNEVGTIDLNANLANYLGSALSVSGTQAGVGRFHPAYFDTLVTPGCGTFTYAGSTTPLKTGQPFTVTVKAKRFGGDTTDATNTANYAGANAYLITLSNAGVTTGLASNTIAAASFANGVGSANVTYEVATPQTALLTLTMRATDADTTPVSSSGHTEGTAEIRSGRAKFGNAHGSELLGLPIPFRTEYWSSNGWVVNSADTCSGDVTLGAGNAVSVTLSSPPATCVQDNGISTGLSGAGCAAAGPVAQRFRKGATPGIGFVGDFNLWLRAPGTGNTGAVTVTGNVPVWLQYPWGSGAAINPAARATFGVYKGNNDFIYLRENY